MLQQQSLETFLEVLADTNKSNNSGTSGEIVEETEGEEETIIVMGISPNSRVSLFHFLMESLPPSILLPSQTELFLRVASALKSIGVTYVVDTAAAGDIALVEAREEFIRRYQANQKAREELTQSSTNIQEPSRTQVLHRWEKPATSSANSATSINLYGPPEEGDPSGAKETAQPVEVGPVEPGSSPLLPVLSSHCPGFVCFAEKSQPQCLDYLSTVKSAQQIMGILMKYALQQQLQKEKGSNGTTVRRRTYVVSVQPCFDKKLEASRRDFDHTAGGLLPEGEEVDLVLSTTEFWHLLEHIASTGCSNIDIGTPSVNSLSASSTIELDPATKVLHHLLYALQPDPMQGRDSLEGLFRSVSADGLSFVSAVDANAGSGGYAEYIFKHAALQLFEVDLFKYTEGKGEGKGEGSTERLKALPYKLGRGGKNPDMAEVDLQSCLESIDHGGGTANAAGGEGTIVVNGVGTGDRSLRFGRAYGFRNIQSVLNQLKKGE